MTCVSSFGNLDECLSINRELLKLAAIDGDSIAAIQSRKGNSRVGLSTLRSPPSQLNGHEDGEPATRGRMCGPLRGGLFSGSITCSSLTSSAFSSSNVKEFFLFCSGNRQISSSCVSKTYDPPNFSFIQPSYDPSK